MILAYTSLIGFQRYFLKRDAGAYLAYAESLQLKKITLELWEDE